MGDYRRYLAALRAADRFVGRVLDVLDQAGPYGAATSVWVTSDHGRGADFASHGGALPESARTWLFARGAAVASRGVVGRSPARRLADLAPTFRTILGLPVDATAQAGTPLDELLAPPDACAPYDPSCPPLAKPHGGALEVDGACTQSGSIIRCESTP